MNGNEVLNANFMTYLKNTKHCNQCMGLQKVNIIIKELALRNSFNLCTFLL